MTAKLDVEVFVDRPLILGEGPVWDDERGELIAVDIERGAVWFGDEELVIGPPVTMVATRASGGYLLGTRDGLHAVNADQRTIEAFVDVEPGQATRMNDGKCDPAGRLFVGSMSMLTPRAVEACALYRLEPGRAPVRVIDKVSLSNGLGWSPDAKTMYFIDSPTGGLDAFDYDIETGNLSRRRRLADVDRGKPDGLCVDQDGCIWVGLWTGGAVRRYTPGGELDQEVEIPVSQVTSCCFGGDDLGTLFITTAARDIREEQPLAGAIFACETQVKGVPVGRFAD